ncbi:MAG: helix-turn-helix transcriptional regulator [Proteobacteria bacterium]|nr:helix-turn-helix transcriptional regulator [Pseudomonadota bacterium]
MIRAPRRSTKSLQSIIAANVQRRRHALGLSQEAFADICGYHRTYIGAIERGERNITISTLCALAVALKVDPKDLLVKSDG